MIESEEELISLERALFDHGQTLLRDNTHVSAHVGLRRQADNLKRSHRWRNGRPLSYHNWLQGKPSGIRDFSCVVWDLRQLNPTSQEQRLWNSSETGNPSMTLTLIRHEFEYWRELMEPGFTDSSCLTKTPFVLCEENNRVIYDKSEVFIEAPVPSPASVAQVMMKGQYVLVRRTSDTDHWSNNGSLVDWTFHFAGQTQLMALSSLLSEIPNIGDAYKVWSLGPNQTLNELSEEYLYTFPMFDCQAGFIRELVPYSRVCDRRSDCSTGKDEDVCGKTGYRNCQSGELACASGHCIPEDGWCDLFPDCADGSDEQDCEGKCRHFRCHDQCIPETWIGDGEADCLNSVDGPGFADEFVSPTYTLDSCLVVCNRTKCVSRNQILDSNTDCTGPEGQLDRMLGSLNGTNCFTKLDMFANNVEDTWAPKCTYLKDSYETVIGCKSFKHLEATQCENYTCPEGFFKCPGSYCIPLHYIGNQEFDCPYGEDEDILETTPNTNFKCLTQSEAKPILLHPSLVCDGYAHCPLSDDEIDCAVTCKDGFQCTPGAVVVDNYNDTKPLGDTTFLDTRTRLLNISGVPVHAEFFNRVPPSLLINLVWLNMSNCGLENLDIMAVGAANFDPNTMTDISFTGGLHNSENFKTVLVFDLSYNKLHTLENTMDVQLRDFNILGAMTNLKHLNLSHNVDLVVTKSGIIRVAHHLVSLDLSYTAASEITAEVMDLFTSLTVLSLKGTKISRVWSVFPTTLQVLDLRLIPVMDIQEGSFRGLTDMQELFASKYTLCCPQIRGQDVPNHVCFTTSDAISSCDDLIQEPILRIMLWVFGCAALLGNMLVVVYRAAWDTALLKRGYGIFVLNLSLSDLLMGVYLMVIAISDMGYRGQYVLHETSWRGSWLCNIAGFLSTWSSESSAMFIFLITLDRFLVIRFPFGQVRFSIIGYTAVSVLAWLAGLCIALVPLLPPFQHWTVYSSNGVCLGLPLTTDKQPGWQFSTFVFVGVNFLLFSFIAVGQIAIYRTMSSARMNVGDSMSKFNEVRRQQDIDVAKQLSLVVISDFFCWFPIGVMGLLALFGTDLGSDVYAWTAILVMPINSAINPVLYTVPALKKSLDGLFGNLLKNQSSGKIAKNGKDKSLSENTNTSNNSRCMTQLNALIDTLKSARHFLIYETVGGNLEALKSKSSDLESELSGVKQAIHGKLKSSDTSDDYVG